MTERYRAVYEHLALGAQNLCNVDTGANQLHQTKTDGIETPHAPGIIATEAEFDYDELAELSSIRNDIDQLMGESAHTTDPDTMTEKQEQTPQQH